MKLTTQQRQSIETEARRHSSARAVLVDGEVRWICEGCGQPLTPSNPTAAFYDQTNHQAAAISDLVDRLVESA